MTLRTTQTIYTILGVQVPILSEHIFKLYFKYYIYIIYTIHVLLSLSWLLCTLSKAIKNQSVQLSLSHTHTHLKHFKFTKYIFYTLFYVCIALSLSLSCCHSIIYIFPSQGHSNIIHWQVKLSSTNLLLLCFRTKYWVLSCSMSHKIQQGSCLWSTL